MRRSVKKAGIVKASLKVKAGNAITIGGADLRSLDSKQAVLEQKIEEAKNRALEESQALLEEAQAQAKSIIEKAENNRHEIEQEAYHEGFEKGTVDATNKINEELAETLKEAANILASVEQERKECLEDEEARVYKVIIEIARKLLKKDFTLNQDISLEFIKSAIAKLEHKSSVNLIINSAVAGKINAVKNTIINEIPGLENLTITASDNQKLGDLIVESNKERLDLRLDSMLDELIATITKKPEQ